MSEPKEPKWESCATCDGEGWIRFDPPDSRMCQACSGTGRTRIAPSPTPIEDVLAICDMTRAEWDQLGEDLRTGKERLDTSWIE